MAERWSGFPLMILSHVPIECKVPGGLRKGPPAQSFAGYGHRDPQSHISG